MMCARFPRRLRVSTLPADAGCGYVHADAIIDNVITTEKAVAMIVVMPNGRALADDRPPASDKTYTPENVEGFAKFERDLLTV